MPTILCVDDDPSVALLLDEALRRAGHRTRMVRHVPDALHALEGGDIDLVVANYRMPGISGRDFLALLQRGGHDVPVVMLAAYSAVEHHVAAMRAGAVACVTKPVRPQQLTMAVSQALEVSRLRRETAALRRELQTLRQDRDLVGNSAAMRRLRQMVSVAAATRATVLIEGESGSGRTTLAQAIHAASERGAGPFVMLDCSALPEDTLAEAIFGEEPAPHLARDERVTGAFERARSGTLLLKEVSALSPEMQTRLLHLLQAERPERAASPSRDTRLIATSTVPLALEVANGRFRPDLHYRLTTLTMSVPPLRDRREDVAALAHHFAARAAERLGREIEGLDAEAVARLQRAAWPGNVRELREVVERATAAAVKGGRKTIGVDALPHVREAKRDHEHGVERDLERDVEREIERERSDELLVNGRDSGRESRDPAPVRAGASAEIVLRSLNVDEAERLLIQRALETTGQNRTRAAELLGMSVRTLRNKLNARPDGAIERGGPERSLTS